MSQLVEKKAELFGSAGARKDGGTSRPIRGSDDIAKRNIERGPATAKRGGVAEAVRASSSTTSKIASARKDQNMRSAVELRKKADDAMKKTWKKWSCDPFSAAPLYDKSATLFRACGENDKGAEAFLDGAECHLMNKSFVLAAKSYKEAAKIMESQGKALDACGAYKNSAQAWMNSGDEGKAGEYLMLAAKQLEEESEHDAASLYTEAVCTLVPDETALGDDLVRVIGARDVFIEATRFLIQSERYEQALNVIGRHKLFLRSEGANHALHKLFVASTLVMLVMGDFVLADKTYKDEHLQDTAYLTTPECTLEEDLLASYRDYDVERLDTLKSDNRILRLEPYFARLARALQIDTEGGGLLPHEAPTNVVVERAAENSSHEIPADNSSHEIPTPEGIRTRVERLRVKGEGDKEIKVGEGGDDDSSKGANADSFDALGNNADIDEAAVIGAGIENNETSCLPTCETIPGDDHDSSEGEFDLT